MLAAASTASAMPGTASPARSKDRDVRILTSGLRSQHAAARAGRDHGMRGQQ
jgi:hypothetical protein